MDAATNVWLPHAPDAALRPFVDAYVGYQSSGAPPGVHYGLPSTASTVVIAFDAPVRIGGPGAKASPRNFWMLAGGPHAGPVEVHHSGGHHRVPLSLTSAGCRAVLSVPATALADELVDLDQLLALPHAAVADVSWEQRFAVIDAALLGAVTRRQHSHSVTPELAQVWSEIARTGGTVRIADCARAVGWSRRRLLDRFRAEFGLGPKQTARIIRFQASRRMLERGDSLARIAAECGYCDQAHLTREWRALTSYSPQRWVAAERRPPPTTAAG